MVRQREVRMIRRTTRPGQKTQYVVMSEDGTKRLGGPYGSKRKAEKRLRQIEWFKGRHRPTT